MKRGTPHMNPAGIPSPMPEGQSRGSPSGMNFMPGAQMDPNMSQQYFMKNGMDPNMVGAIPNMRPPSSHPAGGFNAQGMAANQMAMNQAQRQQGVNGNWQAGPNGQMIPGPQGGPQQVMGQGTQQRPMAPPAAPAATNGRTQPPSPQQNAAPPTPQQGNKAAPKKKNDAKESKAKVNLFALMYYFVEMLTLMTAGYKEGKYRNDWCHTIHRFSTRTCYSYSRDADHTRSP